MFGSTSCKLATCNLNQWALDFDGNLTRIVDSIRQAKAKGATLRNGPELEISGYSCEDHFHEMDTFHHSLESLGRVLEETRDTSRDILCAIGCPIMHKNVRYNCVVFCLNGVIVLIRPKMMMADDGNYREPRWFTAWKSFDKLDEYMLPPSISKYPGQKRAPFGFALMNLNDCSVAEELCEELWSPEPLHISLYLSGADIVCYSSGSHTQLRKLQHRIDLVTAATRKCGGVYMYANHRGCDGTRLYFDGCSMISVNGHVTQQASQFSLQDVEVIVGTVDLEEIQSHRQASNSLQQQASSYRKIPVVPVDFSLCDPTLQFSKPDSPIVPTIPIPQEECVVGPACWLWDYCRRSGQSGFLLPLSGGADSATVASIVYVMCRLAVHECRLGNATVISDIRTLLSKSNITLLDEEEKETSSVIRSAGSFRDALGEDRVTFRNIDDKLLSNCMLHTVYMGTDYSSTATTRRANELASLIGSYHNPINIQNVVNMIIQTFVLLGTKTPQFQSKGGSMTEDLALQNIQARVRMVFAYLSAQLLPWLRNRPSVYLLVLGSANVDESLRGYMTKYDCSSADLNPIGAISKKDLKSTLVWLSDKCGLPVLREIVEAPPTAELRPIAEGSAEDYTQKDEDEMGMTYDELSVFGSFRKTYRCGPVSMFMKLIHKWPTLTPAEVAAKVKRFFYYYSINRHKMTTLTPSYHAESYSPDDNRFDLRPFLYNKSWTRQNAMIDSLVATMATTKKE